MGGNACHITLFRHHGAFVFGGLVKSTFCITARILLVKVDKMKKLPRKPIQVGTVYFVPSSCTSLYERRTWDNSPDDWRYVDRGWYCTTPTQAIHISCRML